MSSKRTLSDARKPKFARTLPDAGKPVYITIGGFYRDQFHQHLKNVPPFYATTPKSSLGNYF